jgi:hypothetical protein
MPAREYQEETTFLRHVIAYDDTSERRQIDERITQAQRDERCVRRAVLVMVWLAALAAAGLMYAAVFFPHHPLDPWRFFSHFIVKFLCAVGLAALACGLSFVALGILYRKRLDERHEECRRFAASVIESRLGRPPASPRSSPGRPAFPLTEAALVFAGVAPEIGQHRGSNTMVKEEHGKIGGQTHQDAVDDRAHGKGLSP